MSGTFMIVLRSLRQHALSTAVTVLSTALACGLVMAVFSVKTQTHDAFTGGPIGFDAVLGARGSQLQLVLNTIFHLETSPGNIPWSMFQEISKRPQVSLAIPYAVGDNYRGYRIVGTTQDLFTKFEYQEGKKFKIRPPGRAFEPQLIDGVLVPTMEAVIGNYVSQKTGLTVGSHFNPYHGITFDESKKHDADYVVVGVMEPTNSPSDRVIWIPIEGVWMMPGHVVRKSGTTTEYVPEAGQTIPDEDKEVSAVMLKFSSPQAGMGFEQLINKQGTKATLAWPIGRVMADLFEKIGWMDKVLEMVAYLVVAVAAGSILASIYNTMNERRREFAILRALGARRGTVFSIIVMEAATISALGSAIGFVVYGLIIGVAAVIVRDQTGVVLDPLQYHPVMLYGPLGMIVVGSLSGLVPAFKAYGTDVATNLVPAT
jgi:putative ABC transport system permease protein